MAAAETFVWNLSGMIAVTVNGTPDERQQRLLVAEAEARSRREPARKLLYILSRDADVHQMGTLLAFPRQGRGEGRIAYTAATPDQREKLAAHSRADGGWITAVFDEVSSACAWLSA